MGKRIAPLSGVVGEKKTYIGNPDKEGRRIVEIRQWFVEYSNGDLCGPFAESSEAEAERSELEWYYETVRRRARDRSIYQRVDDSDHK